MVENAVHALTLELVQLRRTLWLAVQASGGTVEIDETKTDPLWRLRAERVRPGVLKLTSSTMPQPTAQQLLALSAKLEGTMMPIHEATHGTELADYNSAMLQILLKPLISESETGLWVPAGN